MFLWKIQKWPTIDEGTVLALSVSPMAAAKKVLDFIMEREWSITLNHNTTKTGEVVISYVDLSGEKHFLLVSKVM